MTGNDPSPKYAKSGSQLDHDRRGQLISYVERFQTLPQLLGKQGYLSFQSGKLWEGSYQHCGFTHGMTRGFPQPGGRHGDDGLRIGREGIEPIVNFVELAIEANKPFSCGTLRSCRTRPIIRPSVCSTSIATLIPSRWLGTTRCANGSMKLAAMCSN